MSDKAWIEGNRVFDTDEAARYLGLRSRTLDNWRASGIGPRYCKVGVLVKYRQSDLVKFLNDSVVETRAHRGNSQAVKI